MRLNISKCGELRQMWLFLDFHVTVAYMNNDELTGSSLPYKRTNLRH